MKVRKMKRKMKSAAANLLAFSLVSKGFIGQEARKWAKKIYWAYLNSLKKREYSLRQVRWALKRGFLPSHVKNMGITKENYQEFLSPRDYAFLRPLNGIYSKWILDTISVHTIFKPFRDIMPKCYYQIRKRDLETQVIPLYDKEAGNTIDDIVELLKDKGQLVIQHSSKQRRIRVTYKDEKFRINRKVVSYEKLVGKLNSFKDNYVVKEKVIASDDFKGCVIRLIVFNEHGDNPVIGDAYARFRKVRIVDNEEQEEDFEESEELEEEISPEEIEAVEEIKTAEVFETVAGMEDNEDESNAKLFYRIDRETGKLILAESCSGMQEKNPTTGEAIPSDVPYWKEIVDSVERICHFAPQLEFMGLDIVITEDGFKITRMLNHPGYSQKVPFSKETTAFLKKKREQKKAAYTFGKIVRRGLHKTKLKIRIAYCRMFFPKPLLPYLSIRWFQDQFKDFRTNKDTSLKEKIWAFRHGFISYRLHQYGITPDNWKNYIADFEYKWLRHINPKYRHWMEDKITVKYVCSEYNNCFPEYYYHISLKNGKNKVLPMMDCPAGYEGTYEDIFRLVQAKRSLALKPDEGSHGNGFYKFTYDDGKYYLNHEEATQQDVLNILQDEKSQYLVTEYIDMHPEIKRIYDGAVNTIRMIVFKKDGVNPTIGNAYMRFGSKRTGAVDNMGAGGMYARIDVETGKFYDAKIIEANEIKPCLYHPDTNEKIEGYLPNWEKVKKQVLDVAKDIQQLEYFGFDLALTPEGLKFPEINRFPDYPAIEKYSPETIDYLLHKLELKKKQYGYDVNRGRTLFKLPDRS